MKTIRFCLLWCLVVLFAACTPLHRGFEGAVLVSPTRPDIAVSVEDLPMLAHGRLTPFLKADSGYQFPETLLSVYGKDSRSPLAIVALSFVPNNAWEWDLPSFSGPLAQETEGASFGGESYYGTIRIVNGDKDPFSPLVVPAEEAASVDWLAQRFVALEDFWKAKIILEYREPLPASLRGATSVPLYAEEVRAFQARAAKTFQVRTNTGLSASAATPYLETLNAKYLGAFLGNMSPKDFIYPELSR